MAHFLLKQRKQNTKRRHKGHTPRPHNPDFWGLSLHVKSLMQDFNKGGFKAALKGSLQLKTYWKDAQGANAVHGYILSVLGHMALKSEKFKEAHTLFDQILTEAPNSHVAMVGKGDAYFLSGNIQSANDWYIKAYRTAKSRFTAMKYAGTLYALQDFKTVKDVIEPYFSEALKRSNPKGNDVGFLAMAMAIQKQQYDLDWVRLYGESNDWDNPRKVMDKIIRARDKLRNIHQGREYVDLFEKAACTGSKQERRIAEKIIVAYSGAGFIWDTLHERIAASHNVADAVGTMGFVSRHQTPEPRVAASGVRRVIIG